MNMIKHLETGSEAIRTVTNTTLPGYLWHEAVEWEPIRRVWIMLPRFASTTSKYTPGHEHQALIIHLETRSTPIFDRGKTGFVLQIAWRRGHCEHHGHRR